jgi:hypothetical protein
MVYCTFRVQLPLGLGPNEIPPLSFSVTGKTGVSLVNVICVDAVTLGLPLIVSFDTEQLVGVIVSVLLSDPSPEVLSVKEKSPETAMVPPPGHGLLEFTGRLQLSPLSLIVHPDVPSGRTLPRVDARLGAKPCRAAPAGPNEELSALCTALANSCETAWACAGDNVWLIEELPHPVLRMTRLAATPTNDRETNFITRGAFSRATFLIVMRSSRTYRLNSPTIIGCCLQPFKKNPRPATARVTDMGSARKSPGIELPDRCISPRVVLQKSIPEIVLQLHRARGSYQRAT